jgi:5-methyltetrahydrofolate--homocysteine methyltransferase
MSDLEEALCALRAAKETGLAVTACMVFDSGADGAYTMMGVSASDAAHALAGAGADIIGANCGAGVESFETVCRALRSATTLPLWIKANAGLPVLENGMAVYKTTPSEYAIHVPVLLDAGASFIGGCCGTTPDHIRALRILFDTRRP